MEEYREWLEKQVEDANKLLEKNVNLKRYGAADYYDIKLIVYKDCLDTFKQVEEYQKEQGISFNDLEVGKRYGVVTKNGDRIGTITVVSKGRDDYGEYIWYSDKADSNVSFKSYSHEFKTARYFVEEE